MENSLTTTQVSGKDSFPTEKATPKSNLQLKKITSSASDNGNIYSCRCELEKKVMLECEHLLCSNCVIRSLKESKVHGRLIVNPRCRNCLQPLAISSFLFNFRVHSTSMWLRYTQNQHRTHYSMHL